MHYRKRPSCRAFGVLALLATVLLAGCGSGTGDGLGGGGNPQPVAVVISPKAATVTPGGQKQFTAAVQNGGVNLVSWGVLEGPTGGTIDQNGLYTAPATPGTYHVVVSSQVFTTKFDTATVTVQ